MQSMLVDLVLDRLATYLSIRQRSAAAIDDLEYLGNPRAQVAPHKIFEPFEFGLYDYESKIGLWIHVARHLFDPLDLMLDPIIHALEEAIGGPAVHEDKQPR